MIRIHPIYFQDGFNVSVLGMGFLVLAESESGFACCDPFYPLRSRYVLKNKSDL